MDKAVALVEGLILRAPTHGRSTYSNAGKRALVELCKQPGASVAAIALAHRINANLMRRWIKRSTVEPGDPKMPHKELRAALLPVTTSYPGRPRSGPDSRIEIRLNGARVRIRGVVERQALETVLDCLARRG